MRKIGLSLFAGILLGIAAQTFVAIAETWSFGPSLQPLRGIFGSATFPVVTTLALGVPIGLLFFAAARFLRLNQVIHLLSLVAPFGALQLVSLFGSASNGFAWFYAVMFVGVSIVGVVGQVRASAESIRAPRLSLDD